MPVALASFMIFGAAQVGTPGPANMAMLATGARFGFRAALPFVGGVILGKQLIIWPIGFGLMQVAETLPGIFIALKWISAAYIFWLAWKVANIRFDQGTSVEKAPGFFAGLVVHPLNPKAWAMIITGFTNFVNPGSPALQATALIAISFLGIQAVLHPIWAYSGARIAQQLAGSRAEVYLMWTLAALTVLSVLFVLFKGDTL
jgi:threonine/homoserine/homoserine lactone efflux protein